MRHKYDALTREKVWGRIKELWLEGAVPTEITARMQAEGYKMANGKDPITRDYIVKTLYYLKARGDVTEGEAEQSPASDRLPPTVLGVLTDPNLTDTQKVKMICAYADIQ